MAFSLNISKTILYIDKIDASQIDFETVANSSDIIVKIRDAGMRIGCTIGMQAWKLRKQTTALIKASHIYVQAIISIKKEAGKMKSKLKDINIEIDPVNVDIALKGNFIDDVAQALMTILKEPFFEPVKNVILNLVPGPLTSLIDTLLNDFALPKGK